MPLVVYADVIMPGSVLRGGVRGRQMRRNMRAMNQGGFDSINVVWQRTLRQYELGLNPMPPSEWQTIEALFEVTDAGAFGFLFEDPKDHTDAGSGLLQPLSASGVAVGTAGFGYGVPGCRLVKRITSIGSTRTHNRNITRPNGNPGMLRAGAPVVYGAAAGNAAIDTTTGIVTFVADTTQALASVTPGATTVLNFSNGTGMVAALAVGQRVYLTGFSGTAAAALNNLSHAVVAKGATSLTISTATTGLAATGGSAWKYPQPDQSLSWTGRFYVPVHFANDEIDWEMVRSGPLDARLLAGPMVLLQEVRE